MADGDFNLATIWASVVPETSKVGPAMEDAGKEGKRRFGEGIKDLGHTITDDLEKAGSKVKDTFSGVGSRIKDIVSRAGKEGADSLTDSFSKAGADSGHSLVSNFVSQASGLRDFAGNLGDQIGGKLGGAIGDALKQIPGVGTAVDSLQQIGDKATELGRIFDNTKGHVNDFSGAMDSIRKLSPGWAGALEKLAGPMAEIAGFLEAVPKVEDWLKHLPLVGSTFSDLLPDAPDALKAPFRMIGGDILHPSRLWKNARQYDHNGNFIGDGSPPAAGPPAELPPDMRLGPAGGDKPAQPHIGGIGGDTGFNDLFSGGSGIGGAGGTDWDAIHPHEAGSWDANTGNGYYGGLQFDQQTWNDFGGQDFAPRPDLATPDQQKAVANRVPVSQRAGRWPNTYKYGANQGPVGGRHIGSDKGLTPTSISAKDVIASQFPQITDIGGWRPPDGFNEHSSGQALDVMIPNWDTPEGQALGTQIKDFVTQHAKELGVDYALWQQTQWNPGGGKSPMENRGDPNQNHFTHVHVHTTKDGGSDPSGLLSASSRGAVGAPTGAQHDPLYVTQSNAGVGAGSADQAMGSQLGSGLVNGVLQEFGLDGSVFKSFGGSSNPLQFGITKLATGLINTFAGGARGGDGASLGGLGGRGGGSILPGLGGLIPHPAATAVPIGPSGSQSVSGGDTHIYHGPVNSGPQLSVTQNGVQSPTEDLQAAANGAGNRVVAQGVTPQTGPPVP